METNKTLQDIKQRIGDLFLDNRFEFNTKENCEAIKDSADEILGDFKLYSFDNTITHDADSGKAVLITNVKLDKDSKTLELKTEIVLTGIINSEFK